MVPAKEVQSRAVGIPMTCNNQLAITTPLLQLKKRLFNDTDLFS
jgi:hypothetical protein